MEIKRYPIFEEPISSVNGFTLREGRSGFTFPLSFPFSAHLPLLLALAD